MGYSLDKKSNLLIIDDEIAIRDILSELLIGEDFNVSAAASGEEALTMVKAAKGEYHVVILDWHIKGKPKGYELLAALKEADPRLKAVVLSGDPNIIYNFSQKKEPPVAAAIQKPITDFQKFVKELQSHIAA